MNPVTRYEPDFNEDGPTMLESQHGRWVAFQDYEDIKVAFRNLMREYEVTLKAYTLTAEQMKAPKPPLF